MTANEYLALLAEQIHTVIAATADQDGLPVTCAVDILYADENGLYFITPKDKALCQRLTDSAFIALTGIKGSEPLQTASLSLRGKVKNIGADMLPLLFEQNPYLSKICPTPESRKGLTVFQIYEGTGEWCDLSKKPFERDSFTFGKAEQTGGGFTVTEDCIGCGTCTSECPQGCIELADDRAVINSESCLQCGCCADACPVGAIVSK